MIKRLTDDEIIAAADRGSRRFLKLCNARTIGDWSDVLQEGRCLAYEYLCKNDDETSIRSTWIARRVFFALIDLVRSRSKCKTRYKKPVFLELFRDSLEDDNDNIDALERREIVSRVASILTDKEKAVLYALRLGLSQAETARRLGVSRSCINKRLSRIRIKAANLETLSFR